MPKPATQHHWTIPQALAWIAKPGNLEAVSKLSGARVGLWQLPKDRQAQQDHYGEVYVCTLAGWSDLKEQLESHAIEAWGVPFDHYKHVSIPAHEWRGKSDTERCCDDSPLLTQCGHHSPLPRRLECYSFVGPSLRSTWFGWFRNTSGQKNLALNLRFGCIFVN